MFKIASVWGVAILVCVAIVKLTAFGPVILTISAKHGWGVHTGDLVTVVPVGLALVFTVWKVRNLQKV